MMHANKKRQWDESHEMRSARNMRYINLKVYVNCATNLNCLKTSVNILKGASGQHHVW